MSLRLEQVAFTDDVIRLLAWARNNGYEVTLGEAWRTPEQQKIYVEAGRSKTLKSQHLSRLAVDLNVFKDGRLCGRDQIRPLGEYWERLHPKNRWGGSWRGLVEAGKSTFVDTPHFERLA